MYLGIAAMKRRPAVPSAMKLLAVRGNRDHVAEPLTTSMWCSMRTDVSTPRLVDAAFE